MEPPVIAQPRNAKTKPAPKVGFVSLGCPKALVDSERIITRLRAEGYALSADYRGADVVVVNTCGFLDSAIWSISGLYPLDRPLDRISP